MDANSSRLRARDAAQLVALQAESATWLDHLPEALRAGATGETLQVIVDVDLDDLVY